MGEEGEKTCPLCAEEMDLTDQQLKPCKCGYEICVWCWHHIMEMAEKDDSEGRCPACRTPYNKEKIVGAAASCDRLVAGVNTEKKARSNKGKSRTSEGWQQLSSVRVIQRNLVYIVGLPLSFADEDLLHRKDYFGQYGKVLKVSVSRTSTGAIQHFANNTCSVYITYSKEEEALLCIQSVHGFVLEGSTLRACYGTTKYCHAWLRNQSCSNLDCLYLHEFGSQEDCFTKDELISAYTRNRIQQVTGGATNSMQRRFGNALPPPADDYCNRSSANNLPGSLRISPPSSSCGRSVALPAGTSWGPRASHNPPISGSVSSSNGPQKQKLESINGSVTFSAVLASSNTILLPKKENYIKDKPLIQEKSNTILELVEERIDPHVQIDAPDKPVTPNFHNNGSISSKQRCSPAFVNGDIFASSSNITNSDPLLSESCGSGLVDAQKEILVEKIEKTCSDVASISLGRHLGLEEGYAEQQKTSTTSSTAGKSESSENDISASVFKSDGGLHVEAEDKDELLSFDEQRPEDPVFVSSADISGSFHLQNNLRNYHHGQLNGKVSVEDMQTAHKSTDAVSRTSCTSGLLNGYPENNFSSAASLSRNVEHSFRYPKDEKTTNMWKFERESVSNGRNSTLEMGEDSIISNILSLDIDSWDESLTSPQNLVRFLGESDKQQSSPKVLTPWKVHQSNQSRFSFAREESADVGSGASSVAIEQDLGHRSFGHGINLDKFGARDGFSLVNGEERDSYSSSHSDFHFNKLPVSRPQVSAPPGFSTLSRAPPPGFASHERIEQHILNSPSGDYQIGASSLLRNHYQVPQAGNVVNDGDIEFIDPAILAVGKGRFADGLNSSGSDTRSSFSNQFRAFENDTKLQLLMQRSPHQNHRFDTGSSYSSFSADSFGYPSNVMEQSIVNNTSQYSQVALPSHARSPWVPNGHWDNWKEVQGGNNLGISELHHERLGFNNFYTGFEDSKLQMHNQGNVYKPFGV